MRLIVAFIALYILLVPVAFTTGGNTSPGSIATAGATAAGGGGGDSSSRALGLGSGSPSANACQRIILFGFSADVKTCQLQQWAHILGDNPSPVKLQIACQDELLEGLPLCKGYVKR